MWVLFETGGNPGRRPRRSSPARGSPARIGDDRNDRGFVLVSASARLEFGHRGAERRLHDARRSAATVLAILAVPTPTKWADFYGIPPMTRPTEPTTLTSHESHLRGQALALAAPDWQNERHAAERQETICQIGRQVAPRSCRLNNLQR